MPFDPTLPADHAQIVAAELRNQLNALNDLITDLQNQVSALQTQLATRAPRIDGVAAMDIPYHDPPTRDDLVAMQDYANGVVSALQQP
jgi:hypothetical protein